MLSNKVKNDKDTTISPSVIKVVVGLRKINGFGIVFPEEELK